MSVNRNVTVPVGSEEVVFMRVDALLSLIHRLGSGEMATWGPAGIAGILEWVQGFWTDLTGNRTRVGPQGHHRLILGSPYDLFFRPIARPLVGPLLDAVCRARPGSPGHGSRAWVCGRQSLPSRCRRRGTGLLAGHGGDSHKGPIPGWNLWSWMGREPGLPVASPKSKEKKGHSTRPKSL